MNEPRIMAISKASPRLNVTTWGDPALPPVMLVHGMWDHSRSWDAIAQELAPRHHVIAPDLRGHGDSDWAGSDGYTLGAFVRDLADVMEAFNLRQFALVGHSLGGVIGMRLAATFPDRLVALAGIECVTLPIQRDEMTAPKPYPQRLREWIEQDRIREERPPRRFSNPVEAEARLQSKHPYLSGQTVAHLVQHGLRANMVGGWHWKWDPHVRGRPPEDQRGADLRDVLAGLACPTLLIYGDGNQRPPPGPDLLSLMRDVDLHIVPGGSHSLHLQLHDRFMQLLAPFLDRYTGPLRHA